MIQSSRKRKSKESRDKTKNPNLFNRPWKSFKIKAFNLLVELTASSELMLIKHVKGKSIIKQKRDARNNKICKLENKNKENQYKCELFMPKRGVWVWVWIQVQPLKSTYLNRPLWHPTAATINFHWRSQRFYSPPTAARAIPIKFCSQFYFYFYFFFYEVQTPWNSQMIYK